LDKVRDRELTLYYRDIVPLRPLVQGQCAALSQKAALSSMLTTPDLALQSSREACDALIQIKASQAMHRDPLRCSQDRNCPSHSMLFGLSSLPCKNIPLAPSGKSVI
jgi:hypothetical protein